ncbi:Pentatricopeptide repeat-containing protein [Nymphaea thermarum]|nr:Pentatricopeptide repeat-containing protein [Nymphaea thermarum]
MKDGVTSSDRATLISVIGACTKLGDIEMGRQVHCYVIRSNFRFDAFAGNAVIEMYNACLFMHQARQLESCRRFKARQVACLGVLAGCSHMGLAHGGLYYFNLMERDCHIVPD